MGRSAHPTQADREVLDRIRAVRNACDAILEGRLYPDVHLLAGVKNIIDKAVAWQESVEHVSNETVEDQF